MLKQSHLSLYTFLAVLLAITAVGAVTVPFVLSFAKQTYYRLQADVNERQAEAMTRFVTNRLQAGEDEQAIILEFQAAIEGTETDRGYVCLINQDNAQYLGHPDLQVIGMEAKPEALFDKNFSGRNPMRWQDHLKRGESAGGLLSYGPNMPTEVVYFNAVPGTGWTVSSHENAMRINVELRALRTVLIIGAAVLAFLLAIPASLAGRVVTRRYERQRERQNELERQLLEAENVRKTQELEEARQLQLSMLPEAVPEHPTVELAAFMLTATEVGGDYYDFDLADDDTLTLAIGDATGHGMKAGTMVTAAKSLWHAFSGEADLVLVLQKSSLALEKMGLPMLYMALALARVKDHTLELAGAGMPPAFVYRAATKQVETISLKGMPLGGPGVFPYRKTRLVLSSGDTVVLMSDGFPELFNAEGEMLGYERAVEVFEEVASLSPEEIIAHFRETGRNWTNGGAPDDDVTFVVMKVKDKIESA